MHMGMRNHHQQWSCRRNDSLVAGRMHFLWLFISLFVMQVWGFSQNLQWSLKLVTRNPSLRRFFALRSTPAGRDLTKSESEFDTFIFNRNWEAANTFWQRYVNSHPSDWPSFVTGGVHSPYGINKLSLLHNAGDRGEFHSKDTRYHKRRTYAVQIGYVGHHFHGYQQQKHVLSDRKRPFNMTNATDMGDVNTGDLIELPTVEGAIRRGLHNLACFSAGRTDRGVHAVSQIVNFASSDDNITAEGFLQQLQALKEHKEGNLRIYDCVRVPKSFHARSSALWRRYLFVVPLANNSSSSSSHTSAGQQDSLDISCRMRSASAMEFLNRLLHRLCDQELSYRAYSKPGTFPAETSQTPTATPPTETTVIRSTADNSSITEAKGDKCKMLYTRAFVIDLCTGQEIHSSKPADSAAAADGNHHLSSNSIGSCENRRHDSSSSSSSVHDNLCTAKNNENNHHNNNNAAICVELVGNRFLRQMVRILVGTALRETYMYISYDPTAHYEKEQHAQNDDALVAICESASASPSSTLSVSSLSAFKPLPPHGLCFAGVGYDYTQLAVYKNMPKAKREELLSSSPSPS